MRYGAVSYLNARPLTEGLEPLVLAPPAELVELYRAGGIDAALLPVAAGIALGLPRVGSLGVAAEGPVDSVLLFLRVPLDDVRTLQLDPESRTSNVLAQVLVPDARVVSGDADAQVVIGDRALTRAQGDEPRVDLAELWTDRTGLPFVFAAWYGASECEAELELAYARGRERLADYAASAALGPDAEALRDYLEHRIHYRLGPRKLEGLALFVERARARSLL
ncbi:MAG: menaquinone biosynthetic enzyme MqnA/MqnD family protein [Planctomycetota bacterium]|jgi:chorismate dehydratase